jgi:hypothetical protein
MKSTILTLLVAAPLAVAAPLTAVAQTDEISYDFVDLGYAFTETDIGPMNIDGNAMTFEGSVEIRRHIHLAASFFRGEADDLPDTDELTKSFGIGAHFHPGDRWSPWGQVGFIDVDVDVQNVNASDDGFYASGGVRFVPAPGYEVRAGAMYYDLDDSGDDTIATVAGDIALTDVVSLTLSYSDADDSEALAVGFSLYFGRNAPRGLRR